MDRLLGAQLRQGRAADLDFLRALQEAAMRPHVERVFGAWDAGEQRARFEASTDPAAHEIVELRGEAIGCRLVRRHPDALELVRLYLLPSAQGGGLGTRLVEALLGEADRCGLPVRLRVLRGSPAQRLYRRLGFELTGRTATHVSMERRARVAPRSEGAEEDA